MVSNAMTDGKEKAQRNFVVHDGLGLAPGFCVGGEPAVEVISLVTDIDKSCLLSPRERQVIRLRVGLDGGGPRGPTEVSELLGVTVARVKKLEFDAVAKLRGTDPHPPKKPAQAAGRPRAPFYCDYRPRRPRGK